MRRVLLLALVTLLLGGTVATFYAARADTATYAVGWNLVGGPAGSHVVGASGDLYTLQPGDSGYETVPGTAALRGGYGYWAYFVASGSLDTSGSTEAGSYAVTPGDGWIMVGNPASSPATIAGADVAYTYTPADGYQPATSIPPGQAAWVQSAGAVTLTATVAAPASATPTPSPAATPAPGSAQPQSATINPCKERRCVLIGTGTATVRLGQSYGGNVVMANETVTFVMAVANGQVTGTGQFTTSFSFAGGAMCSVPTQNGTFSIRGSVMGSHLVFGFYGNPPDTANVTCLTGVGSAVYDQISFGEVYVFRGQGSDPLFKPFDIANWPDVVPQVPVDGRAANPAALLWAGGTTEDLHPPVQFSADLSDDKKSEGYTGSFKGSLDRYRG